MSMMSPITSAADLPAARKFADDHPSSRWYYAKMAVAYGKPEAVPDGWGGDAITAARKPKLGTGTRFRNLKKSLAGKGIRNPGALAAFIGRKKFGAKRFAKLGAKARTASGALLAAGAPTAEWLRAVRSVADEAGIDPEVLESTVGGGFATAYDETVDPLAYAAEVIDKLYEDLAEEHPDLEEYLQLVGDDEDEDTGDGEDGTDQTTGDDDSQAPAPVDQAAAPANMPVPAVAAGANGLGGAQNFYFGQADPAAFAASLQPHITKMVNDAIVAAYAPADEEDLFDQGADEATEGPDGVGVVDVEGGEPGGDNADGMPDQGAGPEGDLGDGSVVPDVGQMDDAGLEDAKSRLRASFAAAAPPPPGLRRRPTPPGLARQGRMLPSEPGPPVPVPPPSTSLPPSTSVPSGPFPRRRPVMAAADMQARLAARADGGGQGNS